MDDKSNLLLKNLIDAESQLYNNIAELNIINERGKYIKNQLNRDEKTLTESVSNTINERLYALKNEIAIKEAEVISVITQQGEDHSQVKSLKNKINRLKLELESETRNLISQKISVADPIKYRQSLMDSVISINAISASLEFKVDELKNVVSQYELDLGSLPEKILDFTRLTRDLNIHTETYSLMRSKLEEARINEASQVGKVRIVDSAKPILKPIAPKKRMILIAGFFIGLLLSLSIVLLYEFIDQSIKSIDELDSRNLTILAIIPSIGSISRKNKKTKKYQKKFGDVEKLQRRMITREDPKSPISESYRSLRTSLMYSNDSSSKGQVILVSSAGPGEGKTTTIVNLAITYANLGKKTILLDTDLRKPVIHKVFNLDNDKGVTHILSSEEYDYKNVINKTEIDNLDCIPSGIIPPNPSEILASNKMKKLIQNLKEEYDLILLDTPPMLAVTDSFVNLKYTDQFILVVRAGKTEKGALDRTLDQINYLNSPFRGVVLNDVDESNTYGKGYYYSYYQYYYGDK